MGLLRNLFLVLASTPLITAGPDRSAVDDDGCSLHIGERDNLDVRHRRMVNVNLLPERCEDSSVVSIDIPHNGIKRSFDKVKSIHREERRRTAEITGTNTKSHYWYGEDAIDGSTFNYVQDERGNMQGSFIDMSDDSVMQFSVENGDYTAIITKSSDFRPEAHLDSPKKERKLSEGNTEFDFSEEEEDVERELSTGRTESTIEDQESIGSYSRTYESPSTEQDHERVTRTLYDDSGTNLDIMVVWTTKAECKNYGLSEGCAPTDETKTAMEARIELAIDETNTALEMSGVNTQLLLAKSYRHPTFDESSMSMQDTLNGLRDNSVSGTLENRELYGADMVSMIVDSPTYCGIAYIGPRVDLMYSIVAWDCATGYFSFGHELGHNFGLRHDRGANRSCGNERKFHFAYRDPEARFRTILAYSCSSGQCDNNPGGGCPRIQRYSNPTYDFNGLPVGTDMEDNARKINKVRSKIAEYFPHGGTSTSTATTSVESSSSPSSSPESFPSSKPSPSPLPSCNDSPLEFFYQYQYISCTAVASQQTLCSDTNIRAICPATCGTCAECVNPELSFKVFHEVKNVEQVRTCDWTANYGTTRCGFHGMSDTCRLTCDSC